ncbi:MAG: hypothetical protein EBY87_05535, partial [Actinobacteria bacterium]|nr:hypothetical protein [Actinomycetota bacterium]
MPGKNSRRSKKPVLKAPSQRSKPTVIRGHVRPKKPVTPLDSEKIKSNGVVFNVEKMKSNEVLENSVAREKIKPLVNDFSHAKRFTFFRRSLIAILTGSLIFGIGVKVGDQTSNSDVDNAISTIVNSSAKEIDRNVLERAAIEGALKASGDEWANYFPKSALDVLEEQNS